MKAPGPVQATSEPHCPRQPVLLKPCPTPQPHSQQEEEGCHAGRMSCPVYSAAPASPRATLGCSLHPCLFPICFSAWGALSHPPSPQLSPVDLWVPLCRLSSSTPSFPSLVFRASLLHSLDLIPPSQLSPVSKTNTSQSPGDMW